MSGPNYVEEAETGPSECLGMFPPLKMVPSLRFQ